MVFHLLRFSLLGLASLSFFELSAAAAGIQPWVRPHVSRTCAGGDGARVVQAVHARLAVRGLTAVVAGRAPGKHTVLLSCARSPFRFRSTRLLLSCPASRTVSCTAPSPHRQPTRCAGPQARALQAHIENTALSGGGGQAERALATLRGFGGSAVLVSSNLRRALATAVIGLWGRLAQGDRLLVLSELQEISRNPDTLALAPPGGVPDLDSLFSQLGPQFHYGVLDGSTHNGSKPLRGNGLTRLNAFANWVFTRSEDTVVATGHSLYFKHFFNIFLPADATVRLAALSVSPALLLRLLRHTPPHTHSATHRVWRRLRGARRFPTAAW